MEFFFDIHRDDSYMRPFFCSEYVPYRWWRIGGGTTVHNLIALVTDYENPLYSPKSITDILMRSEGWLEGWKIIEADFIEWMVNQPELAHLHSLDLTTLEGRKSFTARMDPMFIYSVTTMRFKILDLIVKHRGLHELRSNQ